jgi:hypothetical protein
MFPEVVAVRREEEHRAVECPAIPLDDADDEVCLALTGNVREYIDRGARDVHARLPVPAVPLASFGRAIPDDGAERHAARIRADERFREHDKPGALPRGIVRE